jgi:hypothetical protein
MCSWIFPFFQVNVWGCWWHSMLFISFQCWSGINFWTTWSWYQIFFSFFHVRLVLLLSFFSKLSYHLCIGSTTDF